MLHSLAFRGFRNLVDGAWAPGPGRHLLVGDNGSGKTSLLEAVYVLATTRSFRTAQLADCVRHGESGFHLAGETAGDGARLEVGWAAAGLFRAVDGRAPTLAEHLAALPVLAWTAADGELLTGGPELRRRFLDRGLVASRPAALGALQRSRRALFQKRTLLVRRASGLEAWNALLAEAAAEVAALRAAHVGALARAFARLVERTALPFTDLTIVYQPSPREALAGKEAILARFESVRAAEERRRVPLLGPHRDELELRWRGRELRRTASAGERKSLGLALVAAQALVLEETRRASPVLLLDDADTELDRGALARVWRAFDGAAQLFATSNRGEVWEEVALERQWRVDGGLLAAR
jgi:DNA replication and repair protein RecF